MKKIQILLALFLMLGLLSSCRGSQIESTEEEASEESTGAEDEEAEETFVLPEIEGIDESAQTALIEAVDAYLAQTSLAQEISLTVDSGGEQMVTEMTLITTGNGTDGELAACGTVTASGTVVETNLYYTEGILYTEYAGTKTKKISDYSNALEEAELISEVTDLLTADSLTAVAQEIQEDGARTISFLIGREEESLQTGGGTIAVDAEGALSSLQACLIGTGEDAETVLILTFTVIGTGEDVSITFPDFSAYSLEGSESDEESESEVEPNSDSDIDSDSETEPDY